MDYTTDDLIKNSRGLELIEELRQQLEFGGGEVHIHQLIEATEHALLDQEERLQRLEGKLKPNDKRIQQGLKSCTNH